MTYPHFAVPPRPLNPLPLHLPRRVAGRALTRPGIAEPEAGYDDDPPPDLPVLSDAQLLAELAGNPPQIPEEGWTALLAGWSVHELQHTLGLSHTGARHLAAAFELHQRLLRDQRPVRPKLNTADTVASFMRPYVLIDHERFWCLPLDPRTCLIGQPILISVGDVNGTEAGPRIFYRPALRVGAVAAIAVHNHPTGDTMPSAEDLRTTRRLLQAGHNLDVPLQDFLIIGSGGAYCSMRREAPTLFEGW